MNGFLVGMSDEQKFAWAKNQVYIALGQLMTTAAMLEIDACPMEGLIPAKYDEILGLENGRYATVVACPMGYRSKDDKYETLPKVRYEKCEIIERI
jgi:nitroreductase